MIADCHTHTLPSEPGSAIVSVAPGQQRLPGHLYSVGIHPWHIADPTSADLEQLRRDAVLPSTVAIGETGLDTLRGAAPLPEQERLLTEHIRLSEELGKPLVIHVVRAHHDIMRLRRTLRARQPWVIHGFRGSESLARQYLALPGVYLSVGEHFNPAALAAIPDERLLLETDTSPLPIAAIAARTGRDPRGAAIVFPGL